MNQSTISDKKGGRFDNLEIKFDSPQIIKLTIVGARAICKNDIEKMKKLFGSLPIGSKLYMRICKDNEPYPGSIAVQTSMSKRVGSIASEEIHQIELAIPENDFLDCVITGKSVEHKAIYAEAVNDIGINKPLILESPRIKGELIFDKTKHDIDVLDMTKLLLHLLKNPNSDEKQILALAQEYAKICCTTLDGEVFFGVHDILFLLRKLEKENPVFSDVCSEIFESAKDLKRYPDDVKTQVYREQYNRILESANKKIGGRLSQMEMYINSLKYENGGRQTKAVIENEAKRLFSLLKNELEGEFVEKIDSDTEFASAVFFYRYSLSSMYVLYTRRIKWEHLMNMLQEFDEVKNEDDKDIILKDEKELCISLNRSQRQMFDKAEEEGIIKYNAERKGYDKGERSSNVLIAYLCGKLFCGDYVEDEGWKNGGRFDEAKFLCKLFGFDVAGTRRKQIDTEKLPTGYKRVDKLFKKK